MSLLVLLVLVCVVGVGFGVVIVVAVVVVDGGENGVCCLLLLWMTLLLLRALNHRHNLVRGRSTVHPVVSMVLTDCTSCSLRPVVRYVQCDVALQQR